MIKPLTVSVEQMADILGIAPRTLQKWTATGCPQESRGLWNVKAVLSWFLENVYEAKNDDSLSEVRKRYWIQKERSEKFKNDIQEGLFAPWSEIEKDWTGRVREVTSGLETFGNRLPAVLEGKSRTEMQAIINEEVRALRTAYARDGKYCPKK